MAGHITFFAEDWPLAPAQWANRNRVVGSILKESLPLENYARGLTGTYLKERYIAWSDSRCGSGATIRISASLLDADGVGIALHIDICEADLYKNPWPGVNNEQLAIRIITSLRKVG